MPPQYVAKDAVVQNSLVAEGCNVYGQIDFASAVRRRVHRPRRRGEGFHHHARQPRGGGSSVVQYAIVSENTVVGRDAVIGARPEEMDNKDEWGVAVVGAKLHHRSRRRGAAEGDD